MAESTLVLHQLKTAANYSKLAMHKCGPRSFKEGQGALVKVLYKFGDGKLSLAKLEEVLGWSGREVIDVAEKAQANGYVAFATSKKGKLSVKLTDKGVLVIEKRLAAEDRAAEEVLAGLSDEERACLLKLCGKVIDTCKGLGVDYRTIAVKGNSDRKPGKHHGCCGHKHGHGHKHGRKCTSKRGHDDRKSGCKRG